MSKFAPVVPVHMATALQTSPEKDFLGGYHLLLAHDVIDKPDAYKDVYGKVRRWHRDSFIIMDNSIIELGKAMEIKDLLRACEILRPDCLVMPDIMGEGEASRQKAVQFHRQYVQAGYELDAKGVQVPPLLGVIQGTSLEDCLATFAMYYTLPMVEYISVPRVIVKQFGTRTKLLMQMAALRGVLQHFKGVHLLGFSDNILDDISCARLPFIQGIDSAVPVRAGLAGLSMNLNDLSWSQKVGPRGDFWEQPIDGNWMKQVDVIRTNLDNYREWISN